MKKKNIIQLLSLAVVWLAFWSCSQKSTESASVKITFPSFQKSGVSPLHVNKVLPATVGDFDCVFVNVMGENIGEWDAHKSQVEGTSKDAYMGIYSNMISPSVGGTFELNVLKGKSRVVQVLGVLSESGCDSASSAQVESLDRFSAMYELARTTVDIEEDTTVTLNSVYDANTATETRYALRAAPALLSVAPDTSNMGAKPSSVVITFDREIYDVSSGLAGIYVVGGTCSVAPTVSAAVTNAKVLTLTLVGGTCNIGENLTLTIDPTKIKGFSGLMGAGSTLVKTYSIVDVDFGLLSISPSVSTTTFTSTTVSGTATTTTLTVTNTGNDTATLGTIDTAGLSLAAPFAHTGGTCTTGQVLAISGSCTIDLNFDPTALGTFTDTLSIDYNDTAANQTAQRNLSAIAITPALLVFSPSTTYDFGSVNVSSTQTALFSITNTGGASATLDTISSAGLSLSVPYSLLGTGTTCATSQVLGYNQSCQLRLQFAPVSAGVASSTIVVSYNNSDGAVTSTEGITGTGVTPSSPSSPASINVVIGAFDLFVTWSDVSGETGYELEREDVTLGSGFSVVATTAANSTGFSDTAGNGLISGHGYHYRVRAVNAGGYSAYSPVSTPDFPAP